MRMRRRPRSQTASISATVLWSLELDHLGEALVSLGAPASVVNWWQCCLFSVGCGAAASPMCLSWGTEYCCELVALLLAQCRLRRCRLLHPVSHVASNGRSTSLRWVSGNARAQA